MSSRQDRARTQSSIPSHTLLTGPIDGGLGRCSEPPRAGTTSSRGTLGPVIHSTCPYPTDGGKKTASGGLQGARRLATGSYSCIHEYGGERVKSLQSHDRDISTLNLRKSEVSYSTIYAAARAPAVTAHVILHASCTDATKC